MMKAKFIYDSSKRMWYKHSSTCCGAVLKQKILYMGKIVTDPNFKIVTSTSDKTKLVPTHKKWWQFWKPKTISKFIKGGQDVKNVRFRYYCENCGKQNDGEWEFVHEDNSPKLNPNKGVSEGQCLVSKTEHVGSSPATPAKRGKE